MGGYHTDLYKIFIRNDIHLQEFDDTLYYPHNFCSVSKCFNTPLIPFSIKDVRDSAKANISSIFRKFWNITERESYHNPNILYKLSVTSGNDTDFYYINYGIILDKHMNPIMMALSSNPNNLILAINNHVNNYGGVIEKYAFSKKLLNDINSITLNPMFIYTNLSDIVVEPKMYHGNGEVTDACRALLSSMRGVMLKDRD